ncbi:antibiotic biosynthesis monooxygenase [Sphingobium sufflavum]|uniref:antibiotic biosynthesis monooxygenase family protein n=1 Tax=Sphingobium sufflavum TaxID=1129547 RepID=UPI001F2AA306|nr:antibiotic biosynthesis monooxygenase [Sphingobium sufflavum]MCE7796835.1 antibiotic biosynthesis monooxygenase [Sphingobium sufflavum]
MLVERSYLHIRDGLVDEFLGVLADKAGPLLRALPGANAVSFGPGLENPTKVILLIEWEDMDAHIAFTKAPEMAEFRALLAPYTVGGEMEHFLIG